MKKINILYNIITFIVIITAASCRKDPVVGGTKVQTLAGEWWVQVDDGDGTGFSSKYYAITTYNTAANNDSLFVDDGDAIWGVKGKVLGHPGSLTFAAANTADYYSDGGIATFSITNGQVVKNGAIAPGSGDKTDAISFTLTFDSSLQGGQNVIKAKGYRRTGWPQDDH